MLPMIGDDWDVELVAVGSRLRSVEVPGRGQDVHVVKSVLLFSSS